MVSASPEETPGIVSLSLPSAGVFPIKVGASVGGGGVIVAAATGFGERVASVAWQEGQQPADAAVSTPHWGQSMLKGCGAAADVGVLAHYTPLDTALSDLCDRQRGVLPGARVQRPAQGCGDSQSSNFLRIRDGTIEIELCVAGMILEESCAAGSKFLF